MKRLSAALWACVTTAACASDIATAPGFNALWNRRDGFGIWLYEESVSCVDGFPKGKRFTVVGPKGDPGDSDTVRLAVKNTQVCASFPTPSPVCLEGKLEMTRNAKDNTYQGHYNLRMSDGSIRAGAFHAQFCE
jgi:hypothetical protein